MYGLSDAKEGVGVQCFAVHLQSMPDSKATTYSVGRKAETTRMVDESETERPEGR